LAGDRALRVEIGRRAREYVVSHFSWEIHAQRLAQVYREAQSNRVQLLTRKLCNADARG